MRPERCAQPGRQSVEGRATGFIFLDGIGYRDRYLPIKIPDQVDVVNPFRLGLESGCSVEDVPPDVIERNKASIHRSPACAAL